MGAGSHPGKGAAVTVILLSLCVFIIGVVVIGGGAALHKIGRCELLADVFRANRLIVCIDQAPLCLGREYHSGNAREQDWKDNAAEKQQDQGHACRLTQAMEQYRLAGCFFHDKGPP